MKRLLSILVLSLVIVQLLMLPAMADASISVPVTTLPATDIRPNSATLNGRVSLPEFGVNGSGGLIFVVDIDHHVNGYFEYGTAPGVYNKTTTPTSLNYSGDPGAVNFTGVAGGLNPCTRYYARAVINFPTLLNYKKQYNDYLISFLSPDTQGAGMRGLGIGLGYSPNVKGINNTPAYKLYYGNVITFTTTGCQIGVLGGGSTGNTNSSQTTTSTIPMANIIVQSAAIATPKVAPGEKVDVTASVTNKGGSNGDAKVTLYVNGQEVESQGVTLSSGQTSPLHFFVSRNEPGTYTVTVGGVSAGSFTVDMFANNDSLIYGIIALLTLGIAGTLYLVTRKRTA